VPFGETRPHAHAEGNQRPGPAGPGPPRTQPCGCLTHSAVGVAAGFPAQRKNVRKPTAAYEPITAAQFGPGVVDGP